MPLKKGDRFKSSLTGKVYGLKAWQDKMVILEREDGLGEVLTEYGNLGIFYSRLDTAPSERIQG